MNVLVVDDYPIERKLLRVQLEGPEIVVSEAEDGVQALQLLKAQKIDAVISDILMPRMDGYQLCCQIRSDRQLRNLPCILLSADYISLEDEKLAMEAGADYFFGKPVSIPVLRQSLQKLIEFPPSHSPSQLLSKLPPLKKYNSRLVAKLEQKNSLLATALDQLKASEERFRILVEQAADAFFLHDERGFILEVNRLACESLGYSRDELTAMTIFQIEQSPAILTAGAAMLALVPGQSGTIRGLHQRKDGTRFPVEVRWGCLELEGKKLFLDLVRDITEREKAEESMREMSGRLLRVQDEERRRIARELHDSTGQTLAALAMNLAVLKRSLKPGEEHLSDLTHDSQELAERCASDLRILSYLLHPPLLDEFGLIRAIRDFAHGFAKRSGIQISLELAQNFPRLPMDVELALFRVVQESLSNTHRHSGSAIARIALDLIGNEVQLMIDDAGHGSITPKTSTALPSQPILGVGIAGMRERLRQLRGRLEIVSGSRGTCVKAVCPVPSEA